MHYLFIFFSFCRVQGMKKVRATGIGVHTPEQITQMGKDDLQVLTDMLGDKTFFFGDEPTTVNWVECCFSLSFARHQTRTMGDVDDFVVFSFNWACVRVQLDVVVFSNIAQLVVVEKEVAHPLRDWLLENCKNLVQHFDKIKEK